MWFFQASVISFFLDTLIFCFRMTFFLGCFLSKKKQTIGSMFWVPNNLTCNWYAPVDHCAKKHLFLGSLIFWHPVAFASNWLSSMDVFFQKRNERWAPCSESQTIWHVTSYPWSLRRSKHGECKLHTPAKVTHPKYYKHLEKAAQYSHLVR